jgi:hypothetical protein
MKKEREKIRERKTPKPPEIAVIIFVLVFLGNSKEKTKNPTENGSNVPVTWAMVMIYHSSKTVPHIFMC